MVEQTQKRPEEEIHGEPEHKPMFGPGSDDAKPAGKSSDPRGDKVASPGALKIAESKGDNSRTSQSASESNHIGFRGGDMGSGSIRDNLINRFTGISTFIRNNKKKTAGGVVAGGVVGGCLFGFSIIQGPLQLVHLAQMLQKYHFLSQSDAVDNRYGKIARYIHHRKNAQVERTRLGYFANKYADRIADKQKKAGIESEYDKDHGYKTRTKINPDVFGDVNQSPEDVKKRIETRYPKANVYIKDGNIYINNKDLGSSTNRSMEKYLARMSGDSGKMGAINGRIMSQRAGFFLHPFNKLDRKAKQSMKDAYNEWREKRKQKIGEGESHGRGIKSGDKDDPDNPNDDDEARRSEQFSSDAQEEVDKFKGTKGTAIKTGFGLAAVAGIGCTLRDLDEGYGDIKQAEVIEPAIRMALDIISTDSQQRSGDDFDIEQMGWAVGLLHGVDSSGEETDFNQANSLLGEEGKDGKGYPESETLKSIGSSSPFAFTNDGVLGTFLDGACSAVGQAIGIIVGIATGPVSGAAGYAFGQAFGPMVQQAALDVMTGKSIDPDAVGAEYGNIVNYGSRLAANAQGTSNGGQPLSVEDENKLASLERETDESEFQDEPFFARMFDVYDSRSVASKIIDNTSSDPGQNITNVASSFLGVSTSLIKIMPLFNNHALADKAVYNYGFPEVGYSLAELDSGKVENPYQNAEDVVTKILPENPEYIERAEKCFGVSIDPSTYETTPSLEDTPSFETVNNDDDCKDNDSEWMQVRFFVFDNNVATAASCYEGDEDSCSVVGAGNEDADTTSSSGSSIGSSQNIEANKDRFTDILYLPKGTIGPDMVGYYHQCQDNRWANKPYPYASGGSSPICVSGCGPATLAMVISTLSSEIINPYELGQKIQDSHVSGGTAMSSAIGIVEEYGLKQSSIGTDDVEDVMKRGGLVVFNANPASPFTSAGHFVVIRAISDDGSKFYVADPADDNGNGQNRNQKAWPMSSLDGWLGPDGLYGVEEK